jgi:hypothetical protein
MNNDIKATVFIKCDCTSHALECQKYKYDEHGNEGFYLSFWHYGQDTNARKSWKERFRWCWRILKTGNPWADSIIATNKSARELAEFILQNLPKEDNK